MAALRGLDTSQTFTSKHRGSEGTTAREVLSGRNLPSRTRARGRQVPVLKHHSRRFRQSSRTANPSFPRRPPSPAATRSEGRLGSVTPTDKNKRLTSQAAKLKVLESDRRMMVSIKGGGLGNKSWGLHASDWKSLLSRRMQISLLVVFFLSMGACHQWLLECP